MIKNLLLQNVLLTFCLMISACAPKAAIIIPPIAQEISVSETENLKQKLINYNDKILSFRALSRTAITYRGRTEKLRQAFVFSRPDKLRVEFLPINSTYTLALLVVDRDGASYLNQQEKTLEKDTSSRRLLQETLKVPADAQELMSYLVGQIPADFITDKLLHIYKADGSQGYVLLSSNGIFKAYLSEDLSMQSFELYEKLEGPLIAQLVFKGYFEKNSIKIPKEIFMNLLQEGVTINLSFSNSILNNVTDDKLFQFNVPSDFTVVNSGG